MSRDHDFDLSTGPKAQRNDLLDCAAMHDVEVGGNMYRYYIVR